MNKRSDAGGLEYLFTEVQCGLTFASLAMSADPLQPQKFERNKRNAQKAYDAILRFKDGLLMSEAETEKLSIGIRDLEEALHVLRARDLNRGIPT